MPKKHRLTGVEMRRTRPARRVGGTLFSLSVSAGGTSPRFGIVVSKKVAARAVDRNLIKRRARAALEKQIKKASSGVYVLVAKNKAEHASYAEILREIEMLMDRS